MQVVTGHTSIYKYTPTYYLLIPILRLYVKYLGHHSLTFSTLEYGMYHRLQSKEDIACNAATLKTLSEQILEPGTMEVLTGLSATSSLG